VLWDYKNLMETYKNSGGVVSHVLNVALLPQRFDGEKDDGILYDKILDAIFQRISYKSVTKHSNICAEDITISWYPINDTEKNGYFTNTNDKITDKAVKSHCAILFDEIVNEINEQFKEYLQKIPTKIEMNVSIPLSNVTCYLPITYGKGG
jgi:hypothetical protein